MKLFSDTKIVRCDGLKLDKNPYIDQDYFDLRKLLLDTERVMRGLSGMRLKSHVPF